MLWFRHVGEVDSTVEAVLARVGLDDLDQRNPAAVLLALRWRLEPLTTLGPEDGRVDQEQRVVRVRLVGPAPQINRVIAHECGHVILLESGNPLPHCECCADRAGRAVCLGRRGLERRLRTESPVEIIGSLTHLFTSPEIIQRIDEVRHQGVRRAVLEAPLF